jgi:hypothetical protein
VSKPYPEFLYVDGGVISRNPSGLGGTWCALHVHEGKVIKKLSGILTPPELNPRLKFITNNHMEAYAALQALLSVPLDWNGCLWTDSMITLHRFRSSLSFKGMPTSLTEQVLERRRGAPYTVRHLKGHPSNKELAAGVSKNGLVVSVFNQMCDKECARLAAEFFQNRDKTT